jgi:AbrB family looped-hinge helix DNA binding protein
MNSIVSEKGQITIPKALRDKLGIQHGSVLAFTEEAGRLIAIRQVTQNPILAWKGKGKLPASLSTDSYLARVRDGK